MTIRDDAPHRTSPRRATRAFALVALLTTALVAGACATDDASGDGAVGSLPPAPEPAPPEPGPTEPTAPSATPPRPAPPDLPLPAPAAPEPLPPPDERDAPDPSSPEPAPVSPAPSTPAPATPAAPASPEPATPRPTEPDPVGPEPPDAPPGSAAAYESRIGPIPADLRRDMERWTWRSGCPVSPDDLRLVELVHLDLDGSRRWGALVVHHDVAEDVAAAFGALYERGFPIERMEPIEHFEGDDDASMVANNTSAFNCRPVAGSSTWSQHAYGRAIDVNPVHNPYVRGEQVSPPAGRDYLDRRDVRPGMLTRPGAVEAFDAIDWGWGGDWRTLKDYQHVSLTGR